MNKLTTTIREQVEKTLRQYGAEVKPLGMSVYDFVEGVAEGRFGGLEAFPLDLGNALKSDFITFVDKRDSCRYYLATLSHIQKDSGIQDLLNDLEAIKNQGEVA